MIKDAELHAAEDHKQFELVNARNQADALIHSVRKSLKEYGDKLSAEEKSKIEAAIAAAETAIKGNDKAEIDAKAQALAEASHKLAEKMYAGAQAEAASTSSTAGSKKQDADVVDAEFEEVKDKK